MGEKPRYSAQNKRLFWAMLATYKTALASGDSRNIVVALLRVHAAQATVPKSYGRYVRQVFRETKADSDKEKS